MSPSWRRSQPTSDALARLTGRLANAAPLDELLLQVVEHLHADHGLASAELWSAEGTRLDQTHSEPRRIRPPLSLDAVAQDALLRAGVTGRRWASIWIPELLEGRGAGPLHLAPLDRAGQLLGIVVVELPDGRPDLPPEALTALSDLARQVALARDHARLDTALRASIDELREQADALRRSRTRLVTVADEERRKIERDLHDGAQQRLLGIAMQVRLAQTLVDDPDALRERLDAIADGVLDAGRELRALAQGIYPPLLATAGLRDALDEAVRGAAGRATIAAGALRRYPPEIEAAVYYCCLEALQNAGKHAPESTARVTIDDVDTTLRFRIADDGPGYDPGQVRESAGLVNMRDRIGAVGGQLTIDAAPGRGVAVTGVVPVGFPRDRAAPPSPGG